MYVVVGTGHAELCWTVVYFVSQRPPGSRSQAYEFVKPKPVSCRKASDGPQRVAVDQQKIFAVITVTAQ